MAQHRLLFRWMSLLLVSGLLLRAGPALGADSAFKADGFAGPHGTYALLPTEHVDPLSGNLLVTATDLVLPGNAGLDLAVTRVYSSQVFPDYENGGSTAFEDDTWAGLGWRLHWGRVLHTELTGGGQTVVDLPGGGGGPLYTTSAYPEGWMTSGLARYNRSTHQLLLPNGRVYTFGQVTTSPRGGTVRYVTRIEDPFGNWITFEYFPAPGPTDGVQRIRQFLSASQIREITFTVHPTLNSLATMTANGRTWTYTQSGVGGAGHSALTRVQPPIGLPTDYGYAAWNGELTSLTGPLGGQLTYTYAAVTRYAGSTTRPSRVVTQRSQAGPTITAGTWTFAYDTGSNKDQTVVTAPCTTTRYTFHGIGLTGDFSAWIKGAVAEQTTEEPGTGVVLERTAFTYVKSELISPDGITAQPGNLWGDSAVFVPLVTSRAVTRGSQTWTTTYDYHWGQSTFNDYGVPWRIVESGERSRTITRTFQTGFTPHILGRVASEDTNGELAASTWTYELSTGFLTSARPYGVTTTYTRHATGNLHTETTPRGFTTTYTNYEWGGATLIQSPLTLTERAVDQDGRVTWTRTGAQETSYRYDALGRRTELWPAGTGSTAVAPVLTAYDQGAGGRQVTESQGASTRTNTLDGFGRVWRVWNGATYLEVGRDACGRVTYETQPFAAPGTDRGTLIAYDALGRVIRQTASDGSLTTYASSGNDQTITDAEGRATTYTYAAAGHPDAGVLASVTDASGAVTRYTYNVAGTLTSVEVPGVPVRTWSYDLRNWLVGDVQPEAGATTYEYDADGRVIRRTNAQGEVTAFTYDADGRLTGRDAPGTASDLTITYDTTGRVTRRQTPGVTTTYTFDGASRVASRTDGLGTLTWTSSYAYDTRSNLTQVTYPSGRVVAYTYDAANRLTGVTQNGAVFADTFTYGANGALTSVRTGAVTQTLAYDTRDRVQTIQAGSLLTLGYGYDRTSQVTSLTDARAGHDQTFQYDALARLTSATGVYGWRGWTYDAAGNRTSASGVGTTVYQYEAATERLTATTGAAPETFTWNALGQLTSDARGTYTYTPAGRLATVTSGAVAASYGYDADDLRISRSVNGHTVYSVRGASQGILSEYEATCAAPLWTRDLIYAGGRLLGTVRSTAPRPTVALVSTAVSASEASGTVQVGVQLTTPGGAALPCAVTVSYGTALVTGGAAPDDFTGTGGVVTFAAGTASGSVQPLTIPVANDAVYEANEPLRVRLESALGARLTGPTEATATILNDEAAPVVSIGPAESVEGHVGTTALALPVTVTGATAQPITVSYATENGTAVAGADYVAASGTLTIPAGTTSSQVVVSVVGETAVEADETLTVRLSAPVGATLGTAVATGTIRNDDAATPQLSIGNTTVTEGASGTTAATLTVTLSPTAGTTVTVAYATSDGTARQPRDYDTTSGVLTFPAGTGTQTVTVPVRGDRLAEGTETCTVVLSSPQGAAIAQGTGTVTILDTDTARRTWGDYDGDGGADVVLFRPSTATWLVQSSTTGQVQSRVWGTGTDRTVVGDFDGDGKADEAVVTLTTMLWTIRQSLDGSTRQQYYGGGGDRPVPADYDGDGKTDIAVYRPTTSTWYVLQSTTNTQWSVAWGDVVSSDVPQPADYDGDGKADVAFYRTLVGLWYVRYSTTGGWNYLPWGTGGANDEPVAADYDGDGRADLAYYKASDRTWYIKQSSNGATVTRVFGTGSTDVRVPADYDGDGKADPAYYLPGAATWPIVFSTGAPYTVANPGTTGDLAVLRRP